MPWARVFFHRRQKLHTWGPCYQSLAARTAHAVRVVRHAVFFRAVGARPGLRPDRPADGQGSAPLSSRLSSSARGSQLPNNFQHATSNNSQRLPTPSNNFRQLPTTSNNFQHATSNNFQQLPARNFQQLESSLAEALGGGEVTLAMGRVRHCLTGRG